MAKSGAEAEMLAQVELLIQNGAATTSEFEGCTEGDIFELERAFPDVSLPEGYLAFLRVMGRKAGPLFRGTNIFYPAPLSCGQYAAEFAVDDDPGLTLDGRFFFAHHQGYQYYFFEADSPTVYVYVEDSGAPELLAGDFVEFIRSAVSRVLSRLP